MTNKCPLCGENLVGPDPYWHPADDHHLSIDERKCHLGDGYSPSWLLGQITQKLTAAHAAGQESMRERLVEYFKDVVWIEGESLVVEIRAFPLTAPEQETKP